MKKRAISRSDCTALIAFLYFCILDPSREGPWYEQNRSFASNLARVTA